MARQLARSSLPDFLKASRKALQPLASSNSANGGGIVLIPNSNSGRPIVLTDAILLLALLSEDTEVHMVTEETERHSSTW